MKRSVLLFFMLIFLIIMALITSLVYNTQSIAAMTQYQKADFSSGVVKADILNVRLGPNLNQPIVCQIYEGDIVRVFAKISNWYLIQNENDCVGMVHEDYLISSDKADSIVKKDSGLSSDEKQLMDLINQKRKNAGLSLLKTDSTLMKISRIKAEDMLNNNYFAHTSPTHGSPFNMMKKYSIAYKAAGENIAGNSTVPGAVDAWMKTEAHKKNILNKNFNYTGIGIVNSSKYGKILVQQFVGR